MMMIAPNSPAGKEEKKRGKVKEEYRRIWGEEEGDADYRGMVRPSQQDATPYEKGFTREGIGH